MINIKDAGRYANHLEGLINSIQSGCLYYPSNYMKTTENHLRSKAHADVPDEVVVPVVNRIFTTQAHNIAHLVNKLIDEKLRLAMAIEKAKAASTIQWEENGEKLTIDAAVEYAKRLRGFALSLSKLNNAKTTEDKRNGIAQKFNVEGNPVSFSYIIEVKNEVDFDKDVVRNLYKKDLEKADKISSLVDQAMSAQIIDFEPVYDIHDNYEQIIAAYEANL
ncbi:MAG TPA: hypothetical protein VK190_03680 [Pseudoneobacillus sp.]|nr:hypothetical protein [Pseudoneobacillus sp.]